MLQSPKKRIWPSLILSTCSNALRQLVGDRKGSKPSMTSTKASASQMLLSTLRSYFFAGAAVGPEPRMVLKKSDEGSSTITSDFLLKVAL